MKKIQAGFTLIELVIVITVIAILAAIALPKYIAIQRDARVAKMQALFGSIRTAAALGKARCELDLAAGLVAVGTCGNAAPQVNMDGTFVDIVNRYPAATALGIDEAASINATNDGLVIAGAAPRTYTAAGASIPATCVINYSAAVAVGTAPATSVVTTGC